ncbi:Xaa-Pro dipeptidase. Metallo peptidase. MEROPS family M24B [Shewanella denitrificans OS217]|jgi:Xaa-Pro dipeptidase|uniref:Xaa-Pro dipeptidase n=1 Tax=Shewanella denitrificans (strain OS217 / ATCC BAA-1090 / DSM 15013) TaxID=318161 RepID=PEPQ_SHEDO|nr:Xaa-Pro dipeptidase [Shewanella denitrificans]Q12TB3.1 RecName: Full=Xaa-Pro dipeptidase; Short=X-Pro dipeptidase; AltName: Full=Imidodipeptidase; AltName: Full=Proline dipeptidase; Short=Prolidase [Shewanella denitrificans OS217]ABE53313.1 Xaa-Pro dipeptidase. Metallo peptidase. MEROPS family M24B [Shewanella denitrificans OS217]
MDQLAHHFSEHIVELNRRVAEIIAREKLSGLVIHSGQHHRQFLDDMNYPFKVNPQFKAWVPVIDNPNCWLIVNGRDKPTLVFYRPVDFWHKVSDVPDAFWTEHVDIKLLTKADRVAEFLPKDITNWAYLGEHLDVADVLGFTSRNPDAVMNYLHYHRASKTQYELECMRQANKIAVKGHQAAKNAFYNGGSEFEIQQQYLSSVGQTVNEVPYGNIVALNQNAAILHYTALEHTKPAQRLSFLLDAGANFHGYASDITRTYAFEKNSFCDLISALNAVELAIIDRIKPGVKYTDLHIETHHHIAQLLLDFNLATGDAAGLVDQGITNVFFPHGLGHMLGLQVHDMGGYLHDERGTHIPAPEAHPYLRCTRTLEANQVLTIEPGLYIIDSLLDELKQDSRKQQINWDQVAHFRPFGGIRIEDNVIVHQDRNENMTREFGLID